MKAGVTIFVTIAVACTVVWHLLIDPGPKCCVQIDQSYEEFDKKIQLASEGDTQAMRYLYETYLSTGHYDEARRWALIGGIHGDPYLTEAYIGQYRSISPAIRAVDQLIILKNLNSPGARNLAVSLGIDPDE